MAFKAMGIDLIIGHDWSSQVVVSLDYVNENDMLLISPSSTLYQIALPNDRLFRVSPNDIFQGSALAEMWETWGVEAVLTIFRDDVWGTGLYDIFEVELASRGITNLDIIRYHPDVTDFSGYISHANSIIREAIATYGIESVGIQLFSFDESQTIQSEASDYPNLMGIIWMSTEQSGRSQGMLDVAGEWATQTHHFSPMMHFDGDTFLYQEFEQLYFILTGYDSDFYTVARYDAAWLLVETILQTASTDAGVIAEALIPVSYRMHGISGWMSLDENGDRMPGLYDIWGFYEDPVTNEYLFRTFGSYDAHAMEVIWDDTAIEYYMGITRPGR